MRQLILFALLFLPRFVCGQEDLYQRLKRGLYQGLPQIHTPNKSLQVLKKVQDVNPSTTTENPFNPYKDGTHSVVLICFASYEMAVFCANPNPWARTCQPYPLVSESMVTQLPFLIVRLF